MLVPPLNWSVRNESGKVALQISRLGIRVPGGLDLLASVRPVMRPHAAMSFHVVLPVPKFFAIDGPESLRADFLPVGVGNFVLLLAVRVIACFLTVEQVTAVR